MGEIDRVARETIAGYPDTSRRRHSPGTSARRYDSDSAEQTYSPEALAMADKLVKPGIGTP